jgi:hypothetical protein
MNGEKKRPTLDELKALHPSVWYLEMAQIVVDAGVAGMEEIKQETLNVWMFEHLTPEKVVELREKLQRATGSTEVEDAA